MSVSVAWAKLSANFHSNRKTRKAGRLGREVFVFVLCSNAARGAHGTIPIGDIDPWYIADQLQMTEDEARDGVSMATNSGLITIEDGVVHICGWNDEWAKKPLTEAERKSNQRARDKSASLAGHPRVHPRSAYSTYAIEQTSTGFLKIGRTTDVVDRVKTLQTASPTELVVIAVREGDFEARMHLELQGFHVSGEWFRKTPESLAIVTANLGHVAGVTVRTVTEERRGEEGEKAEERKERSAARERSPSAPRRRSIPADWFPSEREKARALELGLNVEKVAAEFLSYWLGDGRPKKDWDQTFRNRLEQCSQKPAPRQGSLAVGRAEPKRPADYQLDEGVTF